MGVVAGVISLIGGLSSAYGQHQEAEAGKAQAKYQEKVDRNNAVIATRLAEDALRRGREEELRFRESTAKLKGEQRVAIAKSGVQLGEGTALDILTETAEFGELDALTIRANAEREAFGFTERAKGFEVEAALQKRVGRTRQRAGDIRTTTSLLETAGQVSDRWRT